MTTTTEHADLCPGCFAAKGSASLCPHCGYDEILKRGPLVLPHRTLLHHGQYLIGKVLGKPGGFGITYLALDTKLQTRVAIKEYLPRDLAGRDAGRATISAHSAEDGEFFRYGLTQFLQEARTLAQFDHANIVRVRNFFEENGTGYLVMDYYDGITLADYLAQQPQGKLPEQTAVGIMMPILDGLREVHARNILHRDIKPQNIYLTTAKRPILLDFGAARQAMGERSRSLSVVLSEGYAPYEQYHRRGEQGPWTDIYACAAVLYHAVSGEAPPPATERMHKDELDIAALGVSASLAEALRQGLAADHHKRPQRMTGFQGLLLGGGTHSEAAEIEQKPKKIDLSALAIENSTSDRNAYGEIVVLKPEVMPTPIFFGPMTVPLIWSYLWRILFLHSAIVILLTGITLAAFTPTPLFYGLLAVGVFAFRNIKERGVVYLVWGYRLNLTKASWIKFNRYLSTFYLLVSAFFYMAQLLFNSNDFLNYTLFFYIGFAVFAAKKSNKKQDEPSIYPTQSKNLPSLRKWRMPVLVVVAVIAMVAIGSKEEKGKAPTVEAPAPVATDTRIETVPPAPVAPVVETEMKPDKAPSTPAAPVTIASEVAETKLLKKLLNAEAAQSRAEKVEQHIEGTVPMFCRDSSQVYQPLLRTNYSRLQQAFVKQFGYRFSLQSTSNSMGILTFSANGTAKASEKIYYDVEVYNGGIALLHMHVRLTGISEDFSGNEMCWRTFHVVNGQ